MHITSKCRSLYTGGFTFSSYVSDWKPSGVRLPKFTNLGAQWWKHEGHQVNTNQLRNVAHPNVVPLENNSLTFIWCDVLLIARSDGNFIRALDLSSLSSWHYPTLTVIRLLNVFIFPASIDRTCRWRSVNCTNWKRLLCIKNTDTLVSQTVETNNSRLQKRVAGLTVAGILQAIIWWHQQLTVQGFFPIYHH